RDTDLSTLGERASDVPDVDDLVLGTECVLETLELRQTHVDGHLATLEGRRHVLTCLRALRTAAGGLALRTLTASDAGLVRLRTRCRAQVMQLDGHSQTSSTVTR